MINETVGEQKTKSEKPFPKLMKSTYDNAIVFFEKENCGTYLSSKNINRIGTHIEDFCMDVFVDFNDTLTLQNP